MKTFQNLIIAFAVAAGATLSLSAEDASTPAGASAPASSESGYSVETSKPDALPTIDNKDNAAPDAGGAGTTAGQTGAAGAVVPNQIHATIDSVDASRRRVTVRDDKGNLSTYYLKTGGKVILGERRGSLASLSNGDKVTVTLAEKDPKSITSIQVGS